VPSIGIDETFYSESQEPYLGNYRAVGTNIVRSSRDFSLDLVFRRSSAYTTPSRFWRKLKHVIEPRATYKYVTGIGDDFNRFIRFDENDLASNTQRGRDFAGQPLLCEKRQYGAGSFHLGTAQKRYFDTTFGAPWSPASATYSKAPAI